jgi:hypothetical protein
MTRTAGDIAGGAFAATRGGNGRGSMAVAAIAACIVFSAISPAVAGGFRGTGVSQSWEKIDALVAAIAQHLSTCGGATDQQTHLSLQCGDEKTDLISRQEKLGVSDSIINERLNARNPVPPLRWP